VNKQTVKCTVVCLPLLYVLHLNSRACIQFSSVRGLHKHTQDDIAADDITATFPHAPQFQHQ